MEAEYNEINCPVGTNEGPYRLVYRDPHYQGMIAMDATVSEEMREYHKKAKVQINLPKDFCIKKFMGEENATQEIDE